jgi:hypothetical protein
VYWQTLQCVGGSIMHAGINGTAAADKAVRNGLSNVVILPAETVSTAKNRHSYSKRCSITVAMSHWNSSGCRWLNSAQPCRPRVVPSVVWCICQ